MCMCLCVCACVRVCVCVCVCACLCECGCVSLWGITVPLWTEHQIAGWEVPFDACAANTIVSLSNKLYSHYSSTGSVNRETGEANITLFISSYSGGTSGACTLCHSWGMYSPAAGCTASPVCLRNNYLLYKHPSLSDCKCQLQAICHCFVLCVCMCAAVCFTSIYT